MNERLLRNFIDLVTFDQTLLALERDVVKTRDTINSLQEQKEKILFQIDAERKVLVDLRKEVDECELSMKTLDEDEKEKKKRLDQVENAKEYAAVKSEIERIREKQRGLEQSIIDAWGRLEVAQKKHSANQDSMQNKVKDIDDSLLLLEQSLASLQRQVEEQTVARKQFESLVPEDLMRDYQQMRGRVPNPVVPVEYGSCSACFYSVPAQEISLLKRGVLLPCKSCYRILYIPEESKE